MSSAGYIMIYSTPTGASSTNPLPVSTETSSGSGDQNPGNSSGFFSSNGTPALILAFLAIGLFVGGMVTMFGLRRRRMLGLVVAGRFVGVRRAPDPWELDGPDVDAAQRRAERRRRKFGKKPELHEYHVAECGIDKTEEVRWERVLPISAKVLQIEPSPFDMLPSRSAEPIHRPAYISRLQTLFTTSLRRNAPSNELNGPPTTPVPQLTGMQVAVAIAMPVPPSHHQETGIPDFTLGLAQLPWDAEKQARVSDALAPTSPFPDDS